MDENMADSDLNKLSQESTPPNFGQPRCKRPRGEENSDTDIDIKSIYSLMTQQRKEMEKELGKISLALSNIQKTNTNIESSVAFLTAQNKDMLSKIDLLERQAVKDRDYIAVLESKIEDMQMSNRKSNFQLKNVPKSSGETKEDLIGMVLSLSKTVDCKIEKNEIKDVYRVSSKKEERNSPIIVETSSTLLKTELLQMCKSFNTKHQSKLSAKHVGCRTNTETPIFVSEQLTAKGSRLHFLARDLVKTKKFKFCWTAYGKVYLKRDETSHRILVKSEAQIHQLTQGA